MSFLENTRSPAGLGGRLMVRMMNVGHRALARWGLRFLLLSADAKVLDCGCGGGANIRTLLKKCPQGIVKGVDISDVSVTTARRVNRSAIADGRCAVWQGSVDELIFAADWFDAVTAFETVYFWPDLPKSFREIRRVLRPGGTLLICNECSGDAPGDEAWTKKIAGMRIYPPPSCSGCWSKPASAGSRSIKPPAGSASPPKSLIEDTDPTNGKAVRHPADGFC